MLTDNQQYILQALVDEHGCVSSETLCKKIGVSPRTIRTEIKNINKTQLLIKYVRSRGYLINDGCLDNVLNLLETELITTDPPTHPKERTNYIIARLLISQTRVSIQMIADELYISKTTANDDVNQALLWLAQHDVAIETTSKGRCVNLDNPARIRAFLFLLATQVQLPTKITKLLYSLSDGQLDYRFIMTSLINTLLAYQQSINDNLVIYMANFIAANAFILIKEKSDVPLSSTATRLMVLLEAIGLYTDASLQVIGMRLDRLINQDDTLLPIAVEITDQFVVNSQGLFNLVLRPQEREKLQQILSTIINDIEIQSVKVPIDLEKMKVEMPYAYEISTRFIPLFKSHQLQLNQNALASLTLFLNSILVNKDLNNIDLVLVNNLDEVVGDCLLTGISRTIDIRRIHIIPMHMYEFSIRIRMLDPHRTMVVGTDAHIQHMITNPAIPFFKIDALFQARDIDNLHTGIVQQLKQQHNFRKADAIKVVKPYIQLEPTCLTVNYQEKLYEVEFNQTMVIKRYQSDQSYLRMGIEPASKLNLQYATGQLAGEKLDAFLVVEELMLKYLTFEEVVELKSSAELVTKLLSLVHDK